MARIEVPMPQMGESIAEGTVSKWLKQLGDSVDRDEPILEISTDKVDAEIPAPSSGTLVEILVEEGATVEVGTVVAYLDSEGGPPVAAPEAEAPPPSQAGAEPEAASSPEPETAPAAAPSVEPA
ncbi:MAG: biotin/lipoyl-binding protein, partial [Gemmatimonadota bacterium]